MLARFAESSSAAGGEHSEPPLGKGYGPCSRKECIYLPEGVSTRQSPNKLDIALAYSQFWLRRRYSCSAMFK